MSNNAGGYKSTDCGSSGSSQYRYGPSGGGPLKASDATLRDYFAAKAMTLFEVDSYTNTEWLSGKAYEIADAMIAERAK